MGMAKATREKAKIKVVRATGATGAKAIKVDGIQAEGSETRGGIPARAVMVKAVHTPWTSCGKSRMKIGAFGMD